MSEQSASATTGAGGQLRTLAVRVTEDLRAQLDIIAQLTGRTATEEIRLALEHWIEKAKADPEIMRKAAQVRAEIEREAQTRRNAIAAIFGDEDTASPDATEADTGERKPRRRSGEQAGRVGRGFYLDTAWRVGYIHSPRRNLPRQAVTHADYRRDLLLRSSPESPGTDT